MKSIKYLIWSLTLAAGVFTACTKGDTYEAAEKEGNTVYFAAGTATVSVAEQTSADIAVLRSDDSEAVTVALTVSADDVLTIPTSVSFAAGSKEAKLTVSFDPEELEYDQNYTAELTIADPTITSLYGAATMKLVVTRPAPWVSLGMGLFYDSYIFYVPYEVEFQQNQLYPTNFRLVAPYTEGLQNPEEGYDYDGLDSPYLNFYLLKPGNTLNDTTITKEGLVYYDRTSTFYHPTYEDHVYLYHPSVFVNFQTEESWSYNTVISWQDDAHTLPAEIELAPYYYIPAAGGGWNYTTDPTIYIVFPGVVVADYDIDGELTGFFTDLEDNNYAVIEVTAGADVKKVLLASAEGKDEQALLYAMLDGEVECVELNGSGTANVPAFDGRNVVVGISCDAEGQAHEYFSLTYTKSFGGSGEVPFYPLEEEWTANDIEPMYKDDLFKTWIMWGSDYYDETTDERQPLAYVTFAENDEDDFEDEYGEYDIIDVKGFTMGMTDGDDTHQWEYYMGFILNFYLHENLGTFISQYYVNYVPFISSAGASYAAFYDEMMIGGLVADGYMAMVYSGFYQLGTNPEPDGFLFKAYNDEACSSSAGNIAAIYNIMFEDPKVSSMSVAYTHKPVVSTVQLNAIAKEIATPKNLVELRGRERAHAIIDELVAKKAAEKVEACDVEVKSSAKIRRSHGKELQPAAATLRIQ